MREKSGGKRGRCRRETKRMSEEKGTQVQAKRLELKDEWTDG